MDGEEHVPDSSEAGVVWISGGAADVVASAKKQDQQVSDQRVSSRKLTLIPDRCGTCTRCIEACPTNALDAPYQMDATRCIAYLTIEHKGPIAEELMPGMGRQVFGCDICQDVCPWNRKARASGPIAVDAELEARPELVNPALEWLAAMDEAEFERQFNGSPVRQRGIHRPAAQCGDCDGKQRAGAVCAAT